MSRQADVQECILSGGSTSVRESSLILTPMATRWVFPTCEIVLQPLSSEGALSRRGTQDSRRTSMPYVCHDLVRRLSTAHHATSLISALFRDPCPRVGASAIWDACQLYLPVFHRNWPAFHHNSHLSVHSIPAIMQRNSPAFTAPYLSWKPSDRPYIHENNHQTSKVLFSFLYN
jgi:hypothetical protein